MGALQTGGVDWIQIARDFAEQYGLFALLFVLALWYIHRLWKDRMADKDAEIERLIAEKRRLQDLLISGQGGAGRLTAGGEDDN